MKSYDYWLELGVPDAIACRLANGSNRKPKEWLPVIDFCEKEHGYLFVGITTLIDGDGFMYFREVLNKKTKSKAKATKSKDQAYEYHCLAINKWTRRTVERPPLFSW